MAQLSTLLRDGKAPAAWQWIKVEGKFRVIHGLLDAGFC